MKSIIIVIILITIATISASGQDIISLDNLRFISAKVKEVSEREVKYFDQDKTDGPLRFIPRSSVYKILFSDGTLESINTQFKDKYHKGKEEVIEQQGNAITINN